MPTVPWIRCLDRLEIGDLDFTPAAGRHRATDQPAMRLPRRRRYARCGAPFTSAAGREDPELGRSAADDDDTTITAVLERPCSNPDCAAGVVHRVPRINGEWREDMTFIDDCIECRALGFAPAVTTDGALDGRDRT